MKTRPCFTLMGRAFLALALSFCPLMTVRALAAETAATASASALENSVVKVFSTLRGPDPYKPWSKAAPQEVTGSGVVIEGRRILTHAHDEQTEPGDIALAVGNDDRRCQQRAEGAAGVAPTWKVDCARP